MKDPVLPALKYQITSALSLQAIILTLIRLKYWTGDPVGLKKESRKQSTSKSTSLRSIRTEAATNFQESTSLFSGQVGLSPLNPIPFGLMSLWPLPLSPLPLGPVTCKSNCLLVQSPVGPLLTSPIVFWSTCHLVPLSFRTITP